jgi:hydrogenase maturation protein HypF
VTRLTKGQQLILRRSRGYAPQPISVAAPFVEPILACGAHLKNSFCLGKGRYAFMSHHIGDLENYETLNSFTQGIEHFKNIFDIRPAIVAHDLHPNYLSTQYAKSLDSVTRIGVQHHHAHIAGCMAEHGLSGPVIGVAFDGLGYGWDGAIWGGEFFVADLAHYERRAHLRYVPLAGGDTAIRQPWRMALSYLRDALGQNPLSLGLPGWETISERKMDLIGAMMVRGLNTVQTSSCGRLFDAVASILGLRHEVNYEGQAAVELELFAAGGIDESYPFLVTATVPWEIDMRPMIAEIVREIQARHAADRVAAKFHNTLVRMIIAGCRRLRDEEGLQTVCLSGGTFQNVYLLERIVPALRECHFLFVWRHAARARLRGRSVRAKVARRGCAHRLLAARLPEDCARQSGQKDCLFRRRFRNDRSRQCHGSMASKKGRSEEFFNPRLSRPGAAGDRVDPAVAAESRSRISWTRPRLRDHGLLRIRGNQRPVSGADRDHRF